MKVRAKQTVKAGGEYHIPGEQSAVFEWKPEYGDVDRYIARGVIAPASPHAEEPVLAARGDEDEVETDTARDEIPADFPARKELIKAGIKTLSAVRAIADFDEIKGIGQSKETAILEAIAQIDAEAFEDEDQDEEDE